MIIAQCTWNPLEDFDSSVLVGSILDLLYCPLLAGEESEFVGEVCIDRGISACGDGWLR